MILINFYGSTNSINIVNARIELNLCNRYISVKPVMSKE